MRRKPRNEAVAVELRAIRTSGLSGAGASALEAACSGFGGSVPHASSSTDTSSQMTVESRGRINVMGNALLRGRRHASRHDQVRLVVCAEPEYVLADRLEFPSSVIR